MTSTVRRPPMTYRRAVVVLGALSWLGPFSLDAYTPAFPEMSADLGAGVSTIQLTLTALLIGLILGQLAGGAIVETFGRRMPVLIAAASYCVASAACALAPNVGILIAFRVCQGLTAAVALVAARSVGRDLFEGTRLTKFYSHLAAMTTLAPLTGPVVGAVIVGWSDWRAIFWLITAMGTACLIGVALFLPETRALAPAAPDPAGGRTPASLTGYRTVLADRHFVRCAATLAMVCGVGLTYLAGASFVFQEDYGLTSQQFSLVFASNALVLLIGTQTTARLVDRIPSRTIVSWGLVAQSVIGIGCCTVLVAQAPVPVLWFSFTLLIFFHGVLVPPLTGMAMDRHPEHAGPSSALVGVAQFSVGALVAPALGMMSAGVSTALGMLLPILGALAALTFFTSGASAQYGRHTGGAQTQSNACGLNSTGTLNSTERGAI
ncbi:MFS transporter, DHA1 family, bicyclomycin/chloramphenicol resistance protein [Rhodococcus rhodochrous J3]|uniref:MFS transporter, DHA1 family, bicyclomycin/chloramphenicol resistance protein n=1 Tax=Rhodococcus rhodochrous J3 TaxID=903528 RepID=A0ABY1MCM3_RHORH|nr:MULTISPECIES: multidrug effflux MFS transporter [Rhodococcus]MBF4481137.1 multidrug effflux MFS transporter [Rhodococcus rhodochrous]MDC3728508.1 multidrug effflux MFS transporter [Rhodococcus sp. Rp3]WSE24192.1 multidrug effflux MFS transporter [Rhodococcus sp. PD04]SMG45210.1 MFS transporter, DHA1 family, bicyclomycin/chloramphenicol resistance protein [Rhodococcus rhodochrous J3]